MHLLREYDDQKPTGECGKKGLKESEATTKACEVNCTKCMKTKAFKLAAKHPHYGIPKKKKRSFKNVPEDLDDLEKEMFG
jgi:hypothetical protein